METYFHSVTLDTDKCMGCTNCIKGCPTEAIRVRDKKARIIKERCIDCGECVRICPYHAKKAVSDDIKIINDYDYRIAVPAPTLYGQFSEKFTRDMILESLLHIGFDDVYEVSKAAEIVTEASKKMVDENNLIKPIISSACPAVVRLIQVKFPTLIDHILKIESPMEVAAKIVKSEILSDEKYKDMKTGVFFISPCAAKVTSVKAPYELKESFVDGVISIKDIYLPLLEQLKKLDNKEYGHVTSGFKGISWAGSGGEASSLDKGKYIAVNGIHNIVRVLEEIVEDKLKGVDFIEALSCTEGCLGGPFTVENPFVAKSNIQRHIKTAIEKKLGTNEILYEDYKELLWTKNMEYKPIMKLDNDMVKAVEMMQLLDEIHDRLPGLDCGSCGSPNCRALAEDIVRGKSKEEDCIFKLREKFEKLTNEKLSK